jgi:tRNA threonylcarbamoyl adenosine modification protein (Sua5/YciO/YrdC/YwlC family)
VLPATRETPRRLVHSRGRTIGLRVPGSAIAQNLLQHLGEPMMSTTLIMPGDEFALTDAQDIREQLEHAVDVIIDGGPCSRDLTTVVDLSEGLPNVTRQGLGEFAG